MTFVFFLLTALTQLTAAVLAWRAPAAEARLKRAWRLVAVAFAAVAARRVVWFLSEDPSAELTFAKSFGDIVGVVVSALALGVVISLRQFGAIAAKEREEAEEDRQARRHAEELWRKVFEFAPDGYILLGLDGVLERMNKAARQIAGMTAEVAEGRHLFELGILDNEGMEMAAENLAKMAQGIDPGAVEYTIHRPDGTRRRVEVVGYTLDERTPPLMLTILHDITERRRTEDELRTSRVRLEEAQRVAGVVTWDLDIATGKLWLSETPPDGTNTPGTPAILTLEQSLQHVHLDDRERVARTLAEMVVDPSKREITTEYRQVDFQGRHQIVRAVARADFDEESGRMRRLTGATLDITEIRKAEQEIRQLNAELEERVRERTMALQRAVTELETFSYSVSHDLRSPLRAMAGYSEMVLEEARDRLEPASLERLERIRASSVRMAAMIDDLLSLARLTRAPRNDESIDLTALARVVIEEMSHGDPQRVVDVRIADGLSLRGDAGMMRILLQNLLANAWKFTRGTPNASIEVGRDASGAFFVRDNGVGFDSTQAAKLFRPFERFHRVDEFEGSGIGLATVERIVRRHGGRIWAEAAVGRGSCFYFTVGEHGVEADVPFHADLTAA